MSSIDDLIRSAHEKGASDVFLSAGSSPVVRVNDVNHSTKSSLLTLSQLNRILDDYLASYDKKMLEEQGMVVTAHHESNMNLRLSIYKSNHTLDIAIRLLPTIPPTLEEIHFPDKAKQWAIDTFKPGVMFVTGKRGSGLSTTLASIAQYISNQYSRSILIISDVIEFPITSKHSFIEKIALNRYDNPRNALEQAIQYARNFQTVIIDSHAITGIGYMALLLAQGRNSQIYCTIHEDNLPRWVEELILQAPYSQEEARKELSVSIMGEVNQCLVPTLTQKRVGAYRIMLGTPAIRALILEEKTAHMHSVIRVSRQLGMMSRDDSLLELVNEKTISKEVALRYATYPDQFMKGQRV
ncbi:MAG: hypothetical protein EP297_14485 [Gammaproteobacteria bacterium]|nr:MAG: hypothetical protein EP297_14485 [Gammaproteobacteria bacterium]